MTPGKKLHILYLVQYFNGPDEPGGSRAYQFAQCWAAAGHRVTVVTSNLNHKTLAATASAAVPPGVEVVRLRTYNQFRASFRRRILNFLSYAAQAMLTALKVPDVDLVYASSTPLTTGMAGGVVSLFKRVPFYFEVRDLWPESAVVAGVLKNRTLVRLIEVVERALYRRAEKVIALTEGIRAGVIAKGKDADDVLLVPNGMDDWMVDVHGITPADFPFDPAQHFICTYVGAHGRWNKLETILEAAKALEGTRVRFLLIGGGDYKPQLQSYASQLGLSNLVFHDPVPKAQIFDYLAGSHVGLICTWDHPFQNMVLANKVFDYLAGACPIVAAARGEIPALLDRGNCGWSVTPEQPAELAALLRDVERLPVNELRRRGENGRAHVLRHYLRSDSARTLEAAFRRGAGAPPIPETSGVLSA
jgi:glycosyltransferase involved in cell wall biosynthesis